ncbi:tnfaip3-interacting protein 2 [Plakobranchus ocellatus]|uniref:Tnfaip3-interacting protein 2 n=1 Tax=Plakobranchus ocellatus TaxID=259542 RepID=A0AAV3Z290_9GAST|nr:tnfaip3-interacting protein 2 [Plakobranchus ocellatus]
MMVLVKELQQQLSQYKLKCAGVDTLAVIIKEAKQESVTLARQKKALETAITNLQNRLSTNNLSSSVTIEETDLYVPGTSKQTLDNLARENARLRSLLKSAEHQTGKKPSEDIQELKTLVEELEGGKNQLQAQLQEVEIIKFAMVKQYEERIASLKADMASERETLQKQIQMYKETEGQLLKKSDTDSDKDSFRGDTKSVETQTTKMQHHLVDGVKKSLKLMAEQCVLLDRDLENFNLFETVLESEGASKAQEEAAKVTAENFQEIQDRLREVTLMNQRWQIHSDAKERQHMAGVTELRGEIEAWKQEAESKRAENMRLVHYVEELQVTLSQLQQKPQIDPSIVEILKQQIQVCTEDFTNERKDHEAAINKNKLLQREVEGLKVENEKLKQELENLKLRQTSPPSQPQARQPMQRQSWHPGQFPTIQQYPSVQPRGEGFDNLPQMPAVPFLRNPNSGLRMGAPLSQAGRSQSDSKFAFECDEGPSSLHHAGSRPQAASHSQSELNSGQTVARPGAMASMPVLTRRSSDADADILKHRGAMACPKCSKEFPDEQSGTLLRHIDACEH